MRNDFNSNYTRALGLSPIITVPGTVTSAAVDTTLAEGSSVHFEVVVGAMVATSTLDLSLEYSLDGSTGWTAEPAYGATIPAGLAYNTKPGDIPQILAATGADQLYSLVVNAPVGRFYRVSAVVGTANATVGVVSVYRSKSKSI